MHIGGYAERIHCSPNTTPVLSDQITMLFVLALPVASIAWTVTHEEVFREPREWCQLKCTSCTNPYLRKFFYLFTCEFCFSHYASAALLLITGYRLAYEGWRGFGVALFALVWIANIYMSLFGRLRLDIKHENVSIAVAQREQAAEEGAGQQPVSTLLRASDLPGPSRGPSS